MIYGINLQDVIVIDGLDTYFDYPTKTFTVIYSGISRAAWGLVMAWIVFACEKGYGGMRIEMYSRSQSYVTSLSAHTFRNYHDYFKFQALSTS